MNWVHWWIFYKESWMISGLFPLNHAMEQHKMDFDDLSCKKAVYRAIYSYIPSHEGEIELVAGTNVEVVLKDPSGLIRMVVWSQAWKRGNLSQQFCHRTHCRCSSKSIEFIFGKVFSSGIEKVQQFQKQC